MSNTLAELVAPFIADVSKSQIEVYNEFSLQHELGLFLRQLLPTFKVRFERNVRHFFPNVGSFLKREIDLTITSPDNAELRWAIELKYPRNGQHPEQMFSFCKDIVFTEQLKAAGFSHAGLLVFADDDLFWRGSNEGIYSYFRGGAELNGQIRKPTGAKDVEITVYGRYSLKWEKISETFKYLAVDAA